MARKSTIIMPDDEVLEQHGTSYSARQLWDETIKITEAGTEQRRIFKWWAEHNSDPVSECMAWDTETTGLTFGMPTVLRTPDGDLEKKDIVPFGFSLCIPYKDKLATVWARHTNVKLWNEVENLLLVPGQKVGHNIRYDLKVCAANKIKVAGVNNDTLTMARLHWNRRQKFDLKNLTSLVAPEFDGYEDELKAIMRNLKSSYTRSGYPKGYVNYSFIDDDVIGKYAQLDAFITWLLNACLRPQIEEKHWDIYKRERAVMNVVKGIERRGLFFDVERAKHESKEIGKQIPKLKKQLIKIAGVDFNPASPKQLQKVVIKNLGVDKKLLWDGKKKKVTTGKEQLLKTRIKIMENKRFFDFVETLLELRAYSKLNGTYLKPLIKRAQHTGGIIYFNLNPTDTRTGRMASNDPNLQNIPRPTDKDNKEKHNPVRSCFRSRKGYHTFYVDYSQMEMWITAIETGDERMLAALLSGADIHASVAAEIYGDEAIDDSGEEYLIYLDGKKYKAKISKDKRFKCKAVNFGIIYGMGFKALAVQIKSPEVEAFDLRKNYLRTYSGINRHNAENKKALCKYGYVTDMFGKRYDIEISGSYKALNAQVQGGCAQITKMALLKINKYFKSFPKKYRPHLLNVIHDEIVFEVPDCAKKFWPEILYNVERMMVRVPELLKRGITLMCDGKMTNVDWESKHSYDDWIKDEMAKLERRHHGVPTTEKKLKRAA
jgi:DNA polymerase-1